MSRHSTRGRRLTRVVILTVIVGFVLSGLALTLAQSPQERRQVRAASGVATKYATGLDTYVADSAAAIQKQHDKDRGDYGALLKVVDRVVDRAPKLPTRGTTGYGREHSKPYQDAQEKRRLQLEPFTAFRGFLTNGAKPSADFISAGKKLVLLSPKELLKDIPFVTGDTLRDEVVPPFEKALKRLEKQKTPNGQDLLALDLKTYAEDMIDTTKDGAKKIDKAEPFFFRTDDRRAGLFERLKALEVLLASQVTSQIDSLGPGQ